MNITLSKDLITRIIITLKQIDVRGYDSMDKLVGIVNLFEQINAQAEQMASQQSESEEKEGD